MPRDEDTDHEDTSFIELGDEEHEPELEAAPAEAAEPKAKGRGKASAGVVADATSDDPTDDEEQRLHPILSNADVLAARAKARVALDKERRANAMKAVEDAEKQRLRNEEGLVTGDGAKDELVDVTIDLAEHSGKIVINGEPYWNGFTYPVPRHVADTLREIMTRGWKHQDEADGRDLTQQYQSRRQVQMLGKGKPGGAKMSLRTGAIQNAPKPFAAEELRA